MGDIARDLFMPIALTLVKSKSLGELQFQSQ